MSIELLSNITAFVFIVGITAWWLIGANFQDKIKKRTKILTKTKRALINALFKINNNHSFWLTTSHNHLNN